MAYSWDHSPEPDGVWAPALKGTRGQCFCIWTLRFQCVACRQAWFLYQVLIGSWSRSDYSDLTRCFAWLHPTSGSIGQWCSSTGRGNKCFPRSNTLLLISGNAWQWTVRSDLLGPMNIRRNTGSTDVLHCKIFFFFWVDLWSAQTACQLVPTLCFPFYLLLPVIPFFYFQASADENTAPYNDRNIIPLHLCNYTAGTGWVHMKIPLLFWSF